VFPEEFVDKENLIKGSVLDRRVARDLLGVPEQIGKDEVTQALTWVDEKELIYLAFTQRVGRDLTGVPQQVTSDELRQLWKFLDSTNLK
jgi:hypothetical protein